MSVPDPEPRNGGVDKSPSSVISSIYGSDPPPLVLSDHGDATAGEAHERVTTHRARPSYRDAYPSLDTLETLHEMRSYREVGTCVAPFGGVQ